MDDSQRVIDWVIKNSEILKLSVKAYDWSEITQTKCQMKDCQSTITFKNKEYIGRGTGNTEEVAFIKSIGEAFDRLLFYQSDELTTNGFAIHQTQELARFSAICELIERDRFFCHFLTGTSFYKTNITLSELPIDQRIFQFLNSQSIHLELLEMRKTNQYRSFVCFAHGINYKSPFGLCFGLGCNVNPHSAALSAISECLRHLLYRISNNDFDGVSVKEFEELMNNKENGISVNIDLLQAHEKLSINIDYFNQIKSVFFETQEVIENIPEQLAMEEIEVSNLKWPTELSDIPLNGALAKSNQLQALFFGNTSKEKINLTRLSQFIGKEIQWQQVQKLPHPMN